MKKFWRGFRKAIDLREREEKAKRQRELVEILRTLVMAGGHEAEPEYVEVVKNIYREQFGKEIRKDDLKERIRLFHAAVSERQSPFP